MTGSNSNNNNNSKSSIDPAAGMSLEPETLGPEEFVRQFRALQERVALPEATRANRPFRRRVAHVDPKFVTATINAIGGSAAVQSALRVTDDDLRLEVIAVDHWDAVTEEMKAALRKMLAANDIRRQRVGLKVLQGYRICQQLARDEADEKLLAYVREMKLMNKFGRSRRRTDAPAEALAKKP